MKATKSQAKIIGDLVTSLASNDVPEEGDGRIEVQQDKIKVIGKVMDGNMVFTVINAYKWVE